MYEATVGAGAAPLTAELWKSIDDVIGLVDCDVYSYKAGGEGGRF